VQVTPVSLVNSFLSIVNRGPDNSIIEEYTVGDYVIVIGFHRLSIIDLSTLSDQPLKLTSTTDDLLLICNGEIYNYREIIDYYNFKTETKSDCEVILHLYSHFSKIETNVNNIIDRVVYSLDGVYAFVLLDKRNSLMFSTRDYPIGVRPLFYIKNGFASEMKALIDLKEKDEYVKPSEPTQIHIVNFNREDAVRTIIKKIPPKIDIILNRSGNNLFYILNEAVIKRLHTDRPIGCLLSGGLDSTIISYLVKKNRLGASIPTFCVYMEGANSPDKDVAEMVARDLKSDHHSVSFTFETGVETLTEVIRCLETYDTTTIRASVPMFLLARHIRKETRVKVVFSGEGADEVFGGYHYFKDAPNKEEFVKETKRLQSELYMFDALRADRCVSSCGLELRVPFLDRMVLKYIKMFPEILYNKEKIEKYPLRDCMKGLIPNYVLNRKKDAFSDSVGRDWVTRLKEYADSIVCDSDFNAKKERYPFNTPKTKEEYLYRTIFEQFYPGKDQDKLIPHYWMPRWQDALVNDPSARFI